MRRNKLITSIYFLFLSFFILISCNKETPTETNDENIVGGSLKKPPCGMINKEFFWGEFDHYETAANKVLGIDPDENNALDLSYLSKLKETYGFSHLLTFQEHISLAGNAGFDAEHLMLNLQNPYYRPYKDACDQAYDWWGFYLDEPAYHYTHNDPSFPNGYWFYNPDVIDSLRDDIKSYYGSTTNVIMGTYKWDNGQLSQDFIDDYAPSADIITFTDYWDNGNADQRPAWQLMRNIFGAKFSMSWIRSDIDQNEFSQLFDKADSLGLEGLWLYQKQDTNPTQRDNNLENFCNVAWQKGWLKKFERQMYRQYHWDCDGDQYVFDGIFPGTQLREVYP